MDAFLPNCQACNGATTQHVMMPCECGVCAVCCEKTTTSCLVCDKPITGTEMIMELMQRKTKELLTSKPETLNQMLMGMLTNNQSQIRNAMVHCLEPETPEDFAKLDVEMKSSMEKLHAQPGKSLLEKACNIIDKDEAQKKDMMSMAQTVMGNFSFPPDEDASVSEDMVVDAGAVATEAETARSSIDRILADEDILNEGLKDLGF